MNLEKRSLEMQDFFNEKADGYDEVHLPFMDSKKMICDSLDNSVERILDLGAGTGLELVPIFEKYPNVHVTAIDITENMLKLLKNLTKKEISAALICVILVTTHVFLELKIPDYMSAITQLVQTEGSTIKEILEQGIYMIVCAFASLICAITVGYFAAKVSSSFTATLRKKIFEKVKNGDDYHHEN